MNAEALLPISTDTLLDLITHLRNSGSELSLADAATEAIQAWLAGADCASDTNDTHNNDADTNRANDTNRINRINRANVAEPHTAARSSALGYQWKELFLPDGTDLRMRFDGEAYHARVSGDAIVYQGRRMSPRQLTIAIAGDGRNAWRDLLLRLPGEKNWKPACLLRRNVRANDKANANPGSEAQASPSAVIAAAAASMSDALRSALALVEHSNAHSVQKYERRMESYRRAVDVMGEHAKFD